MKNKNKSKNLAIFLAAAMSAVPLKADILKRVGNFLDNPKSIGIEYKVNPLSFKNLEQINADKDNLMSQYIPNWKILPNPEPRLSGIRYGHVIDENSTYTITASLLNSVNDNTSYNGIYNTPEYKSVSGSEKVGICEKKLGIEKEYQKNEWLSYLVSLGFLWDDVTYSRTSITIYSDDSSVTRDINTSGSSRGGYVEGSLKFKLKTDKKFAKNISVIVTGSLKSNSVGTSGTEKATDSYDVLGNWEDSKNMDFDMTRADLNFEIRYSFGE